MGARRGKKTGKRKDEKVGGRERLRDLYTVYFPHRQKMKCYGCDPLIRTVEFLESPLTVLVLRPEKKSNKKKHNARINARALAGVTLQRR